ncbi:MAG TPA: hypothetical protein VLV88_12220 [Terriglobales bacterium]|nr:hypothetical protein [Terriglobales bacterium]
MRLKFTHIGFLSLFLAAGLPSAASAQNPDTLMPDQSTALARKILGQLIEALGGQAYLNAQESECSGRLSQFGHNADLTEYLEFKAYWHYPDWSRTDYGKKGNIIDLFIGNEGWTLDHGGVSPEPPESIASFQELLRNSVDHLLRFRLNEQGMAFRYGGLDLIDMHPVDWVEITDRDGRLYRLAVRRENHLLERSVVLVPNENELERTEFTTLYSNYHPQEGIQTPFQISRQRNGRRIFQAFYYGCKYNPGLPADFFTKTALEQRFAEVGGKKAREHAEKER